MVSRPVIGSTTTPDFTLDPDDPNLVPHIVEPVAQHHADPMFAGRHIIEHPVKAKPREARHRNVPVLRANVRTRQAQFRVAHVLVIEMNGDRRDSDGTHRPADHAQMALGIEIHPIAVEADLPARIAGRFPHRRRADRGGKQRRQIRAKLEACHQMIGGLLQCGRQDRRRCHHRLGRHRGRVPRHQRAHPFHR
jgi:hypothetical protein